jgi:transposase-like protein
MGVMPMAVFPRSLAEFQRRFPTDAACGEYLLAVRWPGGFVCPGCGHDHGWRLERPAPTFECASCGRQTSVTAGTVLHRTKLPLTTWFWAAYLMATHSNGISALQLQKLLGLGSYKTAWLLARKLRRAMVDPHRLPLAGLVEIDETSLPQRTKADPVGGGGGRARAGKLPVVGAVEVKDGKPGRWRLAAIDDYSANSLHAVIAGAGVQGGTLKSDAWSGYPGAPGVRHDPHTVGPMAAHLVLPWVHRVFANLKRWALGTYHGLRAKHLQAYLDEFVFRFNRRHDRPAAFHRLLGLATSLQPATYHMLINRT